MQRQHSQPVRFQRSELFVPLLWSGCRAGVHKPSSPARRRPCVQASAKRSECPRRFQCNWWQTSGASISPRHKRGFTFNTQAGVGKEFNQIRAGQPRPERDATNLLNKCLKLFLRGERQIFSIHPHPFQVFSRIAVTDAVLDSDCKNGAQHNQRVVVIRRTGLLCVTRRPLTAIIFTQPAHVSVVEFRPTFLHRGKAFFVIVFGSRLEIWHSIQSLQILFCQIPKKRRSLHQALLPFQFGALLFFQIGQFEFGYAHYFCLETLANKLAANSDSSKVFTRWCVTDQICK